MQDLHKRPVYSLMITFFGKLQQITNNLDHYGDITNEEV